MVAVRLSYIWDAHFLKVKCYIMCLERYQCKDTQTWRATLWKPGQHGQFCDQAMGWTIRGLFLSGDKRSLSSQKCPDQLWALPFLLCNGSQGFFLPVQYSECEEVLFTMTVKNTAFSVCNRCLLRFMRMMGTETEIGLEYNNNNNIGFEMCIDGKIEK